MVTCSLSGTLGTLSVSIERITTLRCSALLCSTMARIASGVVSLFAFRNTAVPGER